MRERSRFVPFLLAAILLAGAAAPLLARLVVDDDASSCSCLVKMDCCRQGQCHMGEALAQGGADLPRWAACPGSRHDADVAPVITLLAVCESRFEVEAPRTDGKVFLEGVPSIARLSNGGPDHVPIF